MASSLESTCIPQSEKNRLWRGRAGYGIITCRIRQYRLSVTFHLRGFHTQSRRDTTEPDIGESWFVADFPLTCAKVERDVQCVFDRRSCTFGSPSASSQLEVYPGTLCTAIHGNFMSVGQHFRYPVLAISFRRFQTFPDMHCKTPVVSFRGPFANFGEVAARMDLIGIDKRPLRTFKPLDGYGCQVSVALHRLTDDIDAVV